MYRNLFKQLHKKYKINYGGCCFVAYCVAKKLEILNEPFWLIIQHSKTKGSHYCILSKKYGYLNKDYRIKEYVRLKATSNTILQIYKDNSWSQKYNKKNNSIIQNIIIKNIVRL